MRYVALACDFDGTIAHGGVVDPRTLEALQGVKSSGRRLILVTGRELDDLLNVFPEAGLFDMVVAENGALLYEPAGRAETALAAPVEEDLVQALRERGVQPLSRGRVIVSTRSPNEVAVLEAIRDLGLELQVVFNKGAVMVLPAGVNKASGLQGALKRLKISRHNLAGIGDAENDHAFLRLCETSAAVADALPELKQAADFASRWPDGGGVRDVARRLLRDDLASLDRRSRRRELAVGRDARGREVTLPAHGGCVLFAGSSGGGKSTLAKVFIEQLQLLGYQYCVVDPEGDYEDFEAGVVLGDGQRAPAHQEVLQVLDEPASSAIVNLLGVALAERPAYFTRLLAELLDMRARLGRPHWLIVEEAHHVLPRDNQAGRAVMPNSLLNAAFVTVDPASVLPEALEAVTVALAVGEDPRGTLQSFAAVTGSKLPSRRGRTARQPAALIWRRGGRPRPFEPATSSFEHKRHRRKYAQGDVGAEQSFYFRGPELALNLQAQNLLLFAQLADGVDDETWLHHLRRGDYSRWFREVIKDEDLAAEAAAIEQARGKDADASRALLRAAIERRYTLPA